MTLIYHQDPLKIFKQLDEMIMQLTGYCVYTGGCAENIIVGKMQRTPICHEFILIDSKKMKPLCEFLNEHNIINMKISHNGTVITFDLYKIINMCDLYKAGMSIPQLLTALDTKCAIYQDQVMYFDDLTIPRDCAIELDRVPNSSKTSGILKFSTSHSGKILNNVLNNCGKCFCAECHIIGESSIINDELCKECFAKKFNCKISSNTIDIVDHDAIVLETRDCPFRFSFKRLGSALQFCEYARAREFQVYELIHRKNNIHPYFISYAGILDTSKILSHFDNEKDLKVQIRSHINVFITEYDHIITSHIIRNIDDLKKIKIDSINLYETGELIKVPEKNIVFVTELSTAPEAIIHSVIDDKEELLKKLIERGITKEDISKLIAALK